MSKYITLAILAVLSSATYAASYSVPVPTELADFNVWKPTQAKALIDENKNLDVTYQLPPELVGAECGNFHFTGTLSGSFANVKGDGVYGTCMRAGTDRLSCMIKYPDMAIDEKSRDAALELNFKGNELVTRKSIANLFRDDPAGILLIELPKR